MYLIVGLGNPTKEYERTRHNAGFDAVDMLADKLNVTVAERKHKGLCGKGMIGGEKVILLKPQTYMNLSGESVRSAADFYKIDPEHIIVMYDDIDLDVGKLRVRARGSAAATTGSRISSPTWAPRSFPGCASAWGPSRTGWTWRTTCWDVFPRWSAR